MSFVLLFKLTGIVFFFWANFVSYSSEARSASYFPQNPGILPPKKFAALRAAFSPHKNDLYVQMFSIVMAPQAKILRFLLDFLVFSFVFLLS